MVPPGHTVPTVSHPRPGQLLPSESPREKVQVEGVQVEGVQVEGMLDTTSILVHATTIPLSIQSIIVVRCPSL